MTVIVEGKSYKILQRSEASFGGKGSRGREWVGDSVYAKIDKKIVFIHLFSDLCMREEEEHGPHLNRVSNDGFGPSLDRF